MMKSMKKLSRTQKIEKAQRHKLFTTIFINGKQVRVRRPPEIDGVSIDEFVRQNADPIWLLQNEAYELINEMGEKQTTEGADTVTAADNSTSVKRHFGELMDEH
jgi:hypothetical protein